MSTEAGQAPSAGSPRFADLTDVADSWDKIQPTVLGITHFACSLASAELNDEAAGAIHAGTWELLNYDLEVYDE